MQAFHDAAARLGVNLHVFGAEISPTAPALMFCDAWFEVPRVSDSAYIPSLLKICRDEAVDCLIPTIDTDLLLLANARPQFEAQGTSVLIADPDKVALCRDKTLTSDYLQSLGLNAPKTVDHVTDYHQGFPAFIKPRDGSSSIGAARVDDEDQLKAHAAELGDYVIQPFISGREYTIDIFADYEGHPIFITPRERLAVRSGEVLKTRITQDDRMIDEALAIVQSFAPRGQITAQLIRDEQTEKDWFIEITPRFGGGAPISMLAGANSAEAVLKLLSGQAVHYQDKAARDGAIYSRYDQSICVNEGELL